MKKIKSQNYLSKDIDDDLFCYYEETGELPTDWDKAHSHF